MVTDVVRECVLTECRKSGNVLGPAFFDQHLAVVVDYGKALARILGADLEIVELAAWLHDMAAVRDIRSLPKHPASGAEIAQTILKRNDYASKRAERVARCILSHSVPVQVGSGASEEVCLSNADSMSFIAKPTYWLYFAFRVRQMGYEEGKTWLLQRVESNWAVLIQPARDMIEKEFGQTRELLTAIR
jgi:uncharacterized protein